MENKYILEIDGHSQDGHIILDTSEGLRFHAEFREEQDAKEYIEFKNNKAVQKAKIEKVIEFIKNCGQDKVFADATIIKMLEDLKNGK